MIFFGMMYVLAVILLGLAVFPTACFFYYFRGLLLPIVSPFCILIWCFLLAGAFFVSGFCLVFLAAALHRTLRLGMGEGEHPIGSGGSIKWYVSSALQYLVSIVFMDFLLLTPFAATYLRLMGAKVGKGVQINSKQCADYPLLEIGDGSVIGGHATVIGHSFERGKLILKKVRIGRKVVVGLNAVVLPGAEIGAVIAAGAVLPKDARVEAGAVYAGVPAARVR